MIYLCKELDYLNGLVENTRFGIPDDCLHASRAEYRGQLKCRTCGKIYDETTLEWVEE